MGAMFVFQSFLRSLTSVSSTSGKSSERPQTVLTGNIIQSVTDRKSIKYFFRGPYSQMVNLIY